MESRQFWCQRRGFKLIDVSKTMVNEWFYCVSWITCVLCTILDLPFYDACRLRWVILDISLIWWYSCVISPSWYCSLADMWFLQFPNLLECSVVRVSSSSSSCSKFQTCTFLFDSMWNIIRNVNLEHVIICFLPPKQHVTNSWGAELSIQSGH